MTPVESYQALIHQAEQLEKLAEPAASGGPSFWNDIVKSTRGAIASADYVPPDDLTWGLPKETIQAINISASPNLGPIWLAAAALLRSWARTKREALERQAAEVKAALEAIGQQEK